MSGQRFFRMRLSWSMSLAFAALTFPLHALDINWDGNQNDPAAPVGDNLHWSSPGNWNLDGVPNGAVFDVFIGANAGFPTGVTVDQDVALVEIGSLTLGNNSTLRLADTTTLNVINAADLSGLIQGQGGDFFATTSGGTNTILGNRARFSAASGSTITIDVTTYSPVGLNNGNFTLFSADGVGSMLDLSTLTSIDDAFSNPSGAIYTHTIQAINDGVLDLSGVATITGPANNERLDIRASSGGSIDLSNLATVTGSSVGRTTFIADGASDLTLPSLDTVEHARFFATGGGSISDAGSGGWTYSAAGLNDGNLTLFSADGVGSMLDLSTLTSIDDAFSNPSGAIYTHTIQAINDGVLDLSGVATITGPANNERLDIRASSGGSIDLSNLATVTGSGSGRVSMATSGGGTLRVGGFRTSRLVDLTVADAFDLLDVTGDLRMKQRVTLVAAADARVEVAGRFSHRHTSEANVALGDINSGSGGTTVAFDGNGTQLVEVGGFDLGGDEATLQSFLTNGNFGFGQMVVGTPGQATDTVLLDIADNGNRAGSSEALYLYGNGNGDGLVINAGSTLVLNDLNVYVRIGGTITDLQSLFVGGSTQVAFGDGTIELRREPSITGDVDVSSLVDDGDIDLLFEAISGQSPHERFNLNADATLDMADMDTLIHDVLDTEYGDANLDGFISQADLDAVLLNWGEHCVGWARGDYNGDEFISQADLDAVLLNWGAGTPPVLTGVPEPGSLVLLALSGLLCRRRRITR